MKNGEFHHFWEISATCTGTSAEQVRYSPLEPNNLYRYRCGTGVVQPSRTEPIPVQVRYNLQNRTCTGTGQSCTGTGSSLSFYFNQHSYFGHNLLLSYPI